jgi:hypothetical protein
MRNYVDEHAPRLARRVDPEYLRALEMLRDLCVEIVDGGMTGGRVTRLEGLLAAVDSLEPRQNRWRTDKEVEARL